MTTSSHARLLIVDDEALNLKALCDTLAQEGYSTTGFTSGKEALQALRDEQFDLLLTDLMMPEMDGVSLLRAAFEIDSTLVAIVMSGQRTIETAVAAMRMGALDYILKPFKLNTVLAVISRALTVRRLYRENIQLQEAVAIYELSMAIAFMQDASMMLQKIADAIYQRGDAREVLVLLPALDGKELYVAVACGENAESLQGRRLPMTPTIHNWLGDISDVFAKPGEITNIQTALKLQEIPSDIAIPMLAGGRLVGILGFTPAHPHHPIAPGRIKALNILAGTAASALNAASLVAELRSTEQRYRRLADNAPDIVFRYELQPQRRYTYVNPAVTKVSGYAPEDFYANPNFGFKLVHPQDRPLLKAAFRGKPQTNTVTLRWVVSGGRTVWIEQRHVLVRNNAGRLIAVEGIARDITERINLEEQLRQSQRMEAVGRLAGGVAHDFNNLLTVISGYSDFLLSDLPQSSPHRQLVEQIKMAGDRAASLTRQLLAFSRKQVLQPRVLNLNEVLARSSKMLGRLLGEDIELATVMDPAIGRVKADPGQLEQVLMNLAVNSRDAMPHGGKLTIETGNATLDETYAQGHVGVKPSQYVMLGVSDTGRGMDAATRSRIFEPFFTTKELGHGTGLGLSIVYGIIKQSGGNIWVYSEPGKGTTFKIYLPHIEEKEEVLEAGAAAKRIPVGSEIVLIAEDEEAVRRLTRTILERAGYKVLEAKNAHEALELFQQRKNEIGLVLTDLVMPGMSGRTLVENLKQIQPSTKVLYTSGYSDDVIVRHGHLDAGMPYLQKPYGAGDLLKKVREVLDLG